MKSLKMNDHPSTLSRPLCGLDGMYQAIPALKCWATVGRPPGGLVESLPAEDTN